MSVICEAVSRHATRMSHSQSQLFFLSSLRPSLRISQQNRDCSQSIDGIKINMMFSYPLRNSRRTMFQMGRSKPADLVFSLPLLTSPSLLQLYFLIRTSNFGFEAERTSLSLRSEAENFLKMFLNLHGIDPFQA